MLSHFRFYLHVLHKCFNLCFLACSFLLLPVSLNKLDWWALQLRPVTVILHPKPSLLQNFKLQNANHLIWDVFTSPRGLMEPPLGGPGGHKHTKMAFVSPDIDRWVTGSSSRHQHSKKKTTGGWGPGWGLVKGRQHEWQDARTPSAWVKQEKFTFKAMVEKLAISR